jgi:hypothetical protein
MARVLCASKVEYTLKIKKIVRDTARTGALSRWTYPPRPQNWQDGHGRQPAHPQSYPQICNAIKPRLDTLACG